jgi:hypothetical protein
MIKFRSTDRGSILSAKPSSFTQVGIPLLLDIGVAFPTDCIGFIRTAFLRWGPFQERDLEFNSNLRLSSAASGPNGWFTNIISTILLIMTYCASSQVFLLYADVSFTEIDGLTVPTYQYSAVYGGLINSPAFTALGVGLLGQALITSWSLALMYGNIYS